VKETVKGVKEVKEVGRQIYSRSQQVKAEAIDDTLVLKQSPIPSHHKLITRD